MDLIRFTYLRLRWEIRAVRREYSEPSTCRSSSATRPGCSGRAARRCPTMREMGKGCCLYLMHLIVILYYQSDESLPCYARAGRRLFSYVLYLRELKMILMDRERLKVLVFNLCN